MTEEEFKSRIERRWRRYDTRRNHGRVWAGLFLLLIGGLLLLKTLNVILFPLWFFTWPVFLIALGLFTGFRHGFKGGLWVILILAGGFFLISDLNPEMHMQRFIGPLFIISLGLMFILRPRKNRWRNWNQYGDESIQQNAPANNLEPKEQTEGAFSNDKSDFIDVTSVFGGVKKNVLTKNFKGGDIVSFMGGSEINLTQADFKGKVRIDTTNIFGGTKLIVPASWDVQSEIVAIFGGVDDKRQIVGVNADPDKVLILDGTCMFGGIEIRSF
jgi:predicted membrane protein